ncbi:MAG: DUF4328 domain-containing protein, partial [Planctomycetes bacterium]|nr:DUF4328 domain-containing protein [Planctomycetota bacterium]
ADELARRAELQELRSKVAEEIARQERWTPPPRLRGYDDLTFQAGEILTSRLPGGLTFLAGLVALIVWSTLAYRNLPYLEAAGPSFRAVLVPLLWLIPVINLFLPCALMGEIWHGSDPRRLRHAAGLRLPVIGFWWPVLLAAVGLFVIGVYRMKVAMGIEQMVRATHFVMYSDIALVTAAVLTLTVVVAASWNQSRRYRLVTTLRQYLGG